ncbi:hypothetical protein [Cysteiniphilum sp. 6C5]|uniref:hypothetical protein n=1 Tax=unclassified Cysteiniphilum TaxID=2610889 RepID=UPI003F825E77
MKTAKKVMVAYVAYNAYRNMLFKDIETPGLGLFETQKKDLTCLHMQKAVQYSFNKCGLGSSIMNSIVDNPTEEMKLAQERPLTIENMLELAKLEDKYLNELLDTDQELTYVGDYLAKNFPKRSNLKGVISIITDRVDKANDNDTLNNIFEYEVNHLSKQHQNLMDLDNYHL